MALPHRWEITDLVQNSDIELFSCVSIPLLSRRVIIFMMQMIEKLPPFFDFPVVIFKQFFRGVDFIKHSFLEHRQEEVDAFFVFILKVADETETDFGLFN